MSKHYIFLGIHITVPVIVMFALAVLSSSDLLFDASSLYSRNLIIESLILYYPVLFFAQGLVSVLLKVNIVLSLGSLLAAYISIMFIWLNSSGFLYSLVYLLMGLLGYSLALLTKNLIGRS